MHDTLRFIKASHAKRSYINVNEIYMRERFVMNARMSLFSFLEAFITSYNL
jgi:hypothetical protein